MKIKSNLLILTATAALFANMAYAAIDSQSLADSYLANGYSYVEVQQGPTQTKVEAVNGNSTVEVIYSNVTGEILSQETQSTEDEYAGRTGVEIQTSEEDFLDDDENGDGENGGGYGGGDGDDENGGGNGGGYGGSDD